MAARRGVSKGKIKSNGVGNAKNDGSSVLNLTRRTKKMRGKFYKWHTFSADCEGNPDMLKLRLNLVFDCCGPQRFSSVICKRSRLRAGPKSGIGTLRQVTVERIEPEY